MATYGVEARYGHRRSKYPTGSGIMIVETVILNRALTEIVAGSGCSSAYPVRDDGRCGAGCSPDLARTGKPVEQTTIRRREVIDVARGRRSIMGGATRLIVRT